MHPYALFSMCTTSQPQNRRELLLKPSTERKQRYNRTPLALYIILRDW